VTVFSGEIHDHKTEQNSSSCRAVELLLTTSRNLASTSPAELLSPAADQLNKNFNEL